MRTIKWCSAFGVLLAGVVVGFCQHCHDESALPEPSLVATHDDDCCEEGCDCCRHHQIENTASLEMEWQRR